MSVTDAVVFLTEQMCDRRDECDALRRALRSIADATIDGVHHGMLSARQCHDIAVKALQSEGDSRG